MVISARWTGSGGCLKRFLCAVQACFFCFVFVVVFFVVVVKWMFTCERVKTSHISWCVSVPAQSGPKEKLSLV